MYFSLFVKGFQIGTTAEELLAFFQEGCNGEAARIQLIEGTNQCFINFDKQDACKQAKDFAKNMLFKSQYALFVDYCYPKEMRQVRNEEEHDKKALSKKRQRHHAEQLANTNGTQNLIDILTVLLKPNFQNQNLGNNRRSSSFNQMTRGVPSGGPMQMNPRFNQRNPNF